MSENYRLYYHICIVGIAICFFILLANLFLIEDGFLSLYVLITSFLESIGYSFAIVSISLITLFFIAFYFRGKLYKSAGKSKKGLYSYKKGDVIKKTKKEKAPKNIEFIMAKNNNYNVLIRRKK